MNTLIDIINLYARGIYRPVKSHKSTCEIYINIMKHEDSRFMSM